VISEKGFEYEDFKITFSISIIAYINKVLRIAEAEEKLKMKFILSSKELQRVSL
jgi:hypothetical protein